MRFKRLHNVAAIVLLLTVALVFSCGGGGGGGGTHNPIIPPGGDPAQLTVGQITGPDSIDEGQAGNYSIGASGVSGITYAWSVSPTSAGTLNTPTASTTSFTAGSVSVDLTATIQVTVSASGQSSQTRSKSITVKNVAVSQPPNIISVTPTTGTPGQHVSFAVNVTGTSPFSYSWNFGAGASPATSSSPTPAVSLGGAGSYSCRITVTNSAGSDTLDFTLSVTASGTAPTVTAVVATSFLTGSQSTFTATVTGNPTHYSWNFGGGASPNSSSLISPTVTLGAVGNYSVTVTVTNSYGSDSQSFGYAVISSSITFAQLDGNATLYADDGTYLGLISSNQYLSDSIMNEYGSYGSPYSLTSIFNEYGLYGSTFALQSPWNDYTVTPPGIFLGSTFIAYLSTNAAVSPRVDTYELVAYLLSH